MNTRGKAILSLFILILLIFSSIGGMLVTSLHLDHDDTLASKNTYKRNDAKTPFVEGEKIPSSSHQDSRELRRSIRDLNELDQPKTFDDNQESKDQSFTRKIKEKNSNTSGGLLHDAQFLGSGDTNQQIKVNESLNLIKTERLNTTNSYTDKLNDDFFNLETLPNYTAIKGLFNIKNITSAATYQNIEDNITNEQIDNSAITIAIATSFTVTEEMINISSLRIRISVVIGDSVPSGLAYITGVGPDNKPNNTIYGEMLTIPITGGWSNLKYNNPVTLKKGTYYVVLNQTSPRDCGGTNNGCFIWKYANDDSNNPNNTKTVKYLYDPNLGLNGWGNEVAFDLFFAYEYIALNSSNIAQVKKYSSPVEVDLKYNGTKITNSVNNILLVNGSSAYFTSNVSIIFDLEYKILFTLQSNPLATTSSFQLHNGSITSWNATSKVNSVPTGTYQIQNRTVLFYNLPSDWNATAIYRNGTVFTLDPANSPQNTTYNNGNSTLLINITSNISAWDWRIEFVSPNYIINLLLYQNGTTLLSSPSRLLNTTDRLLVNASFKNAAASGLNATLLIKNPMGDIVFSQTNVSVTYPKTTFTEWNIAATLNTSTNMNGTYTVIVQWLDSTGTKVGYFERFVRIVVQTTMSVSSLSLGEVLIGTTIDLTVNYRSFHNATNLDGATVQYQRTWGTDGLFTQSGTHQSYQATINTTGASPGDTTITIMASLGGHVNHTRIVTLTLVLNSTAARFSDSSVNGTIYYNEIVSINVTYRDAANNSHVTGATVTVNLTSYQVVENASTKSYLITFNSTQISTSLTQFTLNITLSKSKVYLTRNLFLTYLFNLTDSTIVPVVGTNTPVNNSVIKVAFDENQNDILEWRMYYQDIIHDRTIKGAMVSIQGLSTVLQEVSRQELGNNGTWVFKFNPINLGTIDVSITFSKDGYLNAMHVITITVVAATTMVQTANSTSQIVAYDESTRDRFNLTLTYYDVNHSRALPNGQISYVVPSGLSISNTSSAGTWTITINPTQPGTYVLTFTFSQQGYQNATFTITITVQTTFTEVQTTNSTAHVTVFDEATRDQFVLVLTYYDVNHSRALPNGDVTYVIPSGLSINNTSSAGTWTITINPQLPGTYVLTFTFFQPGYQNATFTITINVTATATEALWYPRITTVNVVYSEDDADATNILVQLNDTVHSVLLSEVSVSILNSSNNGFFSYQQPIKINSTTWNVTIDPVMAGMFTVVIQLAKTGYYSQTIVLVFNVSLASFAIVPIKNNDTIVVRFDEVNWTILSISNQLHGIPVVNVTIISNSSFISVTEIGNGQYNMSYLGALKKYDTTETITFQFVKSNYLNSSITVTYVIIAPVAAFDTTLMVVNGNTNMSVEWKETIMITLTWNDSLHELGLVGEIFVNSSENIMVQVDFNLSTRLIVLRIMPLTVGWWTLNVTAFNATLADYFKSASIMLFVKGLPRSTATIFVVTPSSAINDTSAVVLVTYDRNATIFIKWKDADLEVLANATSITISDEAWIVHLRNENGTHLFRLHGVRMTAADVPMIVTLSFASPLFTTRQLILMIRVVPLPTRSVTGVYTRGLIEEENTSKLGYKLGMTFNWTIEDNRSIILRPNVVIYLNGTLISNPALVGMILYFGNHSRTMDLFITFLPEHGYQKGWYNFTLKFGKYGLYNQSYEVLVRVEGFDLELNVDYPQELVKGQPYVFTVFVHYANMTQVTVNSSSIIAATASGVQQQETLNAPVENLELLLHVNVTFNNGTSSIITLSERTNAEGKAIFQLSGSITQQISVINGFSLSTIGDSVSAAINNLNIPLDHPINAITLSPPSTQPTIFGLPIEVIFGLVGLLIVLLLAVAFIVMPRRIRSKTKKETVIQRAREEISDRLSFMSQIRQLIIVNSAGLPVYAVASVHLDSNPHMETAISGLVSSLHTAMSSFQAEFVRSITSIQEEVTSRTDVRTEVIIQQELSTIVAVTSAIKIFVFLSEEPPPVARKIIEKITRDVLKAIEKHGINVDSGVTDPDRWIPLFDPVIGKRLPIFLLRSFAINLDVLDEISTSMKTLTVPKSLTLNVNRKHHGKERMDVPRLTRLLKRMIVVLHPQASTVEMSSEDAQLKWYEKQRKDGLLSSSGKYHFETASRTLKMFSATDEDVYQALWVLPLIINNTRAKGPEEYLMWWHPDEGRPLVYENRDPLRDLIDAFDSVMTGDTTDGEDLSSGNVDEDDSLGD